MPVVSRRRRSLAAAVVLVALTVLSGCTYPLLVAVRNDSSRATPQMMLAPGDGEAVAVPAIAPGSTATVTPVLGGGENTLELATPGGRRYLIRGYFEGRPSGLITVVVTDQKQGVLIGRVSDQMSYAPSGESTLTLER
jgi:hypothetical protein